MPNLLPPPQNAAFLDPESRPSRPWVLFFQNLYNLAQIVLTEITTASHHHFASFTATGQIEDSGYSASSFLPATSPTITGATVTASTMNSTPVGQSVAAAGKFTSLDADSATITGKAAAATVSASSKFLGHHLDSGDTSAVLVLTNGTSQLSVDHVAGAVNILHIVGGASGNSPEISAQGSGTDLDLILTPKGAGAPRVNNSGSFAANGSVATVLGSIGPSGARTTVQKWLTVKDNAGNPFFIPLF